MKYTDFINEASNAMAKLASLRAKKLDKGDEVNKDVSKAELNDLEKHLDALFKHLNIDIEFSKHFFERINDARNGKRITIAELNDIFSKAHNKFGVSISKKPDDWQAVLKSVSSKLNVPFVINLKRDGTIELMSKTVMRKKDFKTPNQQLKVS